MNSSTQIRAVAAATAALLVCAADAPATPFATNHAFAVALRFCFKTLADRKAALDAAEADGWTDPEAHDKPLLGSDTIDKIAHRTVSRAGDFDGHHLTLTQISDTVDAPRATVEVCKIVDASEHDNASARAAVEAYLGHPADSTTTGLASWAYVERNGERKYLQATEVNGDATAALRDAIQRGEVVTMVVTPTDQGQTQVGYVRMKAAPPASAK